MSFTSSTVNAGVIFSILKATFNRDQKQFIKFPKTLADLKALGSTLSMYKGICYWRILLTITLIYIFLQSFMIPGSVLFSILLGFLFPTPLALFVIAFVGLSF
uniref:Transmembrane protein 41B n=1 Tax=Schistocephalus solidus TaxID=70667 RepID=A0A0V0JCZ7_SCHSO